MLINVNICKNNVKNFWQIKINNILLIQVINIF